MASDMVVALGNTSSDGLSLFGHNHNGHVARSCRLLRSVGQAHAVGELVQVGQLKLAQARRTHSVIASRESGDWGYQCGVNESGVAIGRTHVPSRFAGESDGLAGADLVRLALERSQDAPHAVEFMMDLITRHGHSSVMPGSGSGFLIVDRREAFVLIATGKHWALQSVGGVRALGETCQVRKDWDRVSHGLGDAAIARGWWPADGSKIDFEGAVCSVDPVPAACLRRWGQLTLRLEQQSGRVNSNFMRDLLGENCLSHADRRDVAERTIGSFVVGLDGPGDRPQVWYSFGPPFLGLYFPLTFESELPSAFTDPPADKHSVWNRTQQLAEVAAHGPWQWQAVHEALSGLQARFDQMAAEYHVDARPLRQRGEMSELERLAESFLLSNLEQWDEVSSGLLGDARALIAELATLSIG